MAGALVRMHHAYDARRFMLPPDVESGYQGWFGQELQNKKARILVVESAPQVLQGYAYARVEPKDWNALRHKCVMLHDIFVEEDFRRHGAAGKLIDAVAEWSTQLHVGQLVLNSAWQNAGAHALFESRGFRRTMVEMTRDLDDGK